MAMPEVDDMGKHLHLTSGWDVYFGLIVFGGRPELIHGVSHFQFGSRQILDVMKALCQLTGCSTSKRYFGQGFHSLFFESNHHWGPLK